MKMNRQNPGGPDYGKPTTKGCEFGKAQGKGKGTSTGGTLATKYSMNAPGMSGMSMKGCERSNGHAHTSMSGSTVTGTTKANRQ